MAAFNVIALMAAHWVRAGAQADDPTRFPAHLF
jgi:hypothetical protein